MYNLALLYTLSSKNQRKFTQVSRTNKMSGLVAHDLSCFICTSGGAYKADKITSGDLRK